jgi:hypothetical protein
VNRDDARHKYRGDIRDGSGKMARWYKAGTVKGIGEK